VGIGEFLVRHAEEAPLGLTIRGLGSCVAVFLHERDRKLAGLAHILLPEPLDGSPLTRPGRFAPTAVAGMLDEILQRGGRRERITAKLAGGAHMFSNGQPDKETLGDRNIRAALEALGRGSIRVVAMETGGSCGRTVLADLTTGTLTITSLKGPPREI
jgi:chemotaxis protein CheD